MRSSGTRRELLAGAAAALAALASPARALDAARAEALVGEVVAEINSVIGAGAPLDRMIASFERIFGKYADVPTIARSVLGPAARSAAPAELRAFATAFQGYMARKYGRQFRSFEGNSLTIVRAEPWKSHYQVHTVIELRGREPISVVFRVSGRSGRDLFFDLLIEGISLLKTEAVEIGALLERRRGDIARLTADLRELG